MDNMFHKRRKHLIARVLITVSHISSSGVYRFKINFETLNLVELHFPNSLNSLVSSVSLSGPLSHLIYSTYRLALYTFDKSIY
jgi:hypothetical protein